MRIRVGGEEERNIEQTWEQVKWAMIDNAKEVCSSVRVRGKLPKEYAVELCGKSCS